ncbi:MAG: hypothetical protein KDK39_17810 [Leptospiraceae bacterium]|nr:hypothetical protein [Leptospiraceae bacterium]
MKTLVYCCLLCGLQPALLLAQNQIETYASSLQPGNMMALSIEDVRSSSHLKESAVLDHKVANLADGRIATAWVEGAAKQGIGEWIQFRAQTQQICMRNGFQKSKALWAMNSRVQSFAISLDGEPVGTLLLKDNMQTQCVDLTRFKTLSNLPIVKLTIKGVYPGSRFEDTCVAEIWSQGG